MKSKIVVIFMVLAGLGFIISLAEHASAILGSSLFAEEPWFLHHGLFVVWIPTALCARFLARGLPKKRMWKAALRGCPKLMRYMVYALFGYTFLNFALSFATSSSHASASTSTIRLFSGHWLFFYYTAFATLYSYLQLEKQAPARLCQNGHVLGLSASSCPECGVAVGDALAGER